MSIFESFGVVAAICIAVFVIPQVFNLLRTKNTTHINIWMYLIYAVGCYVYVIIGIINASITGNIFNGLQFILANGTASIVTTIILVWKIHNLLRANKLHVTEAQYCASLRSPRKEVS
ncbi:MAG: hypothetical protein LBT77_00865 [Mycoplasmataceae bacterium]|jgi:uncharacterized protein with PQ loop repeat|nr:hypothetical protein [Mycoplasmataceae bacterium]